MRHYRRGRDQSRSGHHPQPLPRGVDGLRRPKGLPVYAIFYAEVDPMTGRERRRWHPAGTDRNETCEMAARLAAQVSPPRPRRA